MRPKSDESALTEQNLCCSYTPYIGNMLVITFLILFFFFRFISANMRPKSDKTVLIEQNLCCSHTPCIDFRSS